VRQRSSNTHVLNRGRPGVVSPADTAYNHLKIACRDKPLKVPFRLIANASSQAVRSRPYNTLEDLTDWPRDSGYAVCAVRVVLRKAAAGRGSLICWAD